LAPARATGVGGAFAAYAEGVDAIASNAAAVAVRVPYSFDWLDFDLTLGISFPAPFSNSDFDNDGKVGFTYENFYFYSLGGKLQFGPWGVGVLADFQTYGLLPAQREGVPQLRETLGKVHAVVGRSLLGGQLAVGGGLRLVTFAIDSRQSGVFGSNELSMQNAAPEVGIQIRPDYVPWRLGATFRAPVEGRVETASAPPEPGSVPFIPPAGVALPWELEVGAAIQLGPRPLNPQWINPHDQESGLREKITSERAARQAAQDLELDAICDPNERADRARQFVRQETFMRREEDLRFDERQQNLRDERRARYLNWPRERITVFLELLVSGKVANAIGLESYFSGQAALAGAPTVDFRRSGESLSYSPRLGFEGEPVANRLQTRFGTYIEPSRFDVPPRQHFTFGFNVKLIPFSGPFRIFGDQVWQIAGIADLAPRYQSFGVSLGAWH
jgi:hypothetical protein